MNRRSLMLLAIAAAGGALLLARYGRQQLTTQLAGGFTAGELEQIQDTTPFLEAVAAGARALVGQAATGYQGTVYATKG